MNYDIFNGDADGIIALLQLRFSNPVNSTLVSGTKRDINLMAKVDAAPNDNLVVLDISMAKNISALRAALKNGAKVFYVDHHQAGDIPSDGNLEAHIDLDANTCTSLIIDKLLDGKFHYWAITAAYGDNLIKKADELATAAGLNEEQRQQLKELGTLINYNGYGADINDLHFHPADLYTMLRKYPSPFDAITDRSSRSAYKQLRVAYQDDLNRVQAVEPTYQSDKLKVFELPDNSSSRRISGIYGNLVANQSPDSAHAVLTRNRDNSYTVSLRAPLNNKQGAADICSQFAGGGGRAAAAGINALQPSELDNFIQQVENYY